MQKYPFSIEYSVSDVSVVRRADEAADRPEIPRRAAAGPVAARVRVRAAAGAAAEAARAGAAAGAAAAAPSSAAIRTPALGSRPPAPPS